MGTATGYGFLACFNKLCYYATNAHEGPDPDSENTFGEICYRRQCCGVCNLDRPCVVIYSLERQSIILAIVEFLLWLKWSLTLLTICIACGKCWWIVHASRRPDLIISPKVFTLYSSRRIVACSSYTKRQFMSASNRVSVAFWSAASAATMLWIFEPFVENLRF